MPLLVRFCALKPASRQGDKTPKHAGSMRSQLREHYRWCRSNSRLDDGWLVEDNAFVAPVRDHVQRIADFEEGFEWIMSDALLGAVIDQFALREKKVGFFRPAKIAASIANYNANCLVGARLPSDLAFANARLAAH